MAIEQKKLLQFLRNGALYANKEAAESALKSVTADLFNSSADGSPLLARYTEGTTVKTLLGIFYSKGDVFSVTIYDDGSDTYKEFSDRIDEIVEASGLASGATGISYSADTTANYIQNADSLANADSLLDAALKEVEDYAKNLTISALTPTSAETNLAKKYALVNEDGDIVGDTIDIDKDKFLQKAELVSSYTSGDTVVEEPALELTFITADGSPSVVDLPVKDLIDKTDVASDKELKGLEKVVGATDAEIAASGISTSFNDTNYLSDETSLVDGIKELDTQLKTVADNVAANKIVSDNNTITVTAKTGDDPETSIDVNHDKVTIKQYVDEDTNGFTKDGITEDELYAADAIIEEGFKVLGVEVGTLKSGTEITAGTSVIELLKEMLVKEIDVVAVKPTVSLSSNVNSNVTYEVGDVINPTLKVSYTDGKYTGATSLYTTNQAANCVSGDTTFRLADGTSSVQTNPYAVGSVTLGVGANSFSASTAYAASTVTPKKNNGKDSSVTIAAGTANTSTITYTAKYKYYVGNTEALVYSDLTSANIKAADIVNGWLETGNTVTYSKDSQKIAMENKNPYTSNGHSIFIAVPTAYTLYDVYSTLGASIADSFKVAGKGASVGTVNVEIGRTSTMDYTVYLFPITTGAQVSFINLGIKLG